MYLEKYLWAQIMHEMRVEMCPLSRRHGMMEKASEEHCR
jgi:hypothetical protein